MESTSKPKILLKTAGIAAIAIAAAVVFRAGMFTDADLENYIQASVLNGTVPQFDISKVSVSRISRAYINVAKRLGDDPGAELKKNQNAELNLYIRIRNKAKERGLTVKVSIDPVGEVKTP